MHIETMQADATRFNIPGGDSVSDLLAENTVSIDDSELKHLVGRRAKAHQPDHVDRIPTSRYVRRDRQVMALMHPQHESKTKLLDATLKVVRAKGYTATRIEDICAEAGVTKGSFFHHFKSKEELALAAAAHWDANASRLFASAPYHDAADPLDRLIAYVNFRKALLVGGLPDFTCFAGTIVQEAYRTHPEVSAACERSISSHAKRSKPTFVRRCGSTVCVATGPRKACTSHPSRNPRWLHSGQGERTCRSSGRQSRSPAPLSRTSLFWPATRPTQRP